MAAIFDETCTLERLPLADSCTARTRVYFSIDLHQRWRSMTSFYCLLYNTECTGYVYVFVQCKKVTVQTGNLGLASYPLPTRASVLTSPYSRFLFVRKVSLNIRKLTILIPHYFLSIVVLRMVI